MYKDFTIVYSFNNLLYVVSRNEGRTCLRDRPYASDECITSDLLATFTYF
jgi:hypothetical protein